LADEGEAVADSGGDVLLSDGGGSVLFVSKTGVALHVEFAECLEFGNLCIQIWDGRNLLQLLLVRLEFTLALVLGKLNILVNLLAEVSEGLSLCVKEEVVELTKVELDGGSLLLLVLL